MGSFLFNSVIADVHSTDIWYTCTVILKCRVVSGFRSRGSLAIDSLSLSSILRRYSCSLQAQAHYHHFFSLLLLLSHHRIIVIAIIYLLLLFGHLGLIIITIFSLLLLLSHYRLITIWGPSCWPCWRPSCWGPPCWYASSSIYLLRPRVLSL